MTHFSLNFSPLVLMSYNLSQVPPEGVGWVVLLKSTRKPAMEISAWLGMVDCYHFIFYPQQVHQHTHVCISFFLLLIFIGVQLLYSVILVSTVQKNESATHVHICIPFRLPSLSGRHRPLEEFPVL